MIPHHSQNPDQTSQSGGTGAGVAQLSDPHLNYTSPLHTAKPSTPEVLAASPTPLALLQALKRRWRLAVLFGILLGLIGGIVAWFLSPPTYRVRALVHIAANRPYWIYEN